MHHLPQRPLLFLSLLALWSLTLASASAAVTTYPVPTGLPAGPDFQVWADNVPIPLFKVDGSYNNENFAGAGFGKHVAAFAFSGTTTVRVRYKADFSTATVHPTAYGITATKTAVQEATFTIADPQRSKLIVRLDGSLDKELFLWADPPVDPIPANAVAIAPGSHGNPGSGVWRYSPGKHTFTSNTLSLDTDTTIYLEPGTVLNTRIVVKTNARNVGIIGRGLIFAPYGGYNLHQIDVKENVQDITLQGFMMTNDNWPDKTSNNSFLDAHQIKLRGNPSQRISVLGVKTSSDYFTSDAMSVAGNNVTVTDCFFTSADNAIVIGLRGETRNARIERNVIHQWRGAYSSTIFPQGRKEPGLSTIVNATFRDLYVVSTMGSLLAANTWGENADAIDNLLLENVYVERLHCYDQGANSFAVRNNLNQFMRVASSYNPAGGATVTFRNVHFPERKASEGLIQSRWTVTYDRVYYDEDLVESVPEARLTLNGGTLIIANSGVDTTPPPAPTGLSASGTGPVNLDWANSSASDLASYRVYRRVGSTPTASPSDLVATGLTTSAWTDANPPAGEVRYAVTAVDTAGNASSLSSAVAVIIGNPNQAPTVAITAPTAGSEVFVGSTVTLAAAAADVDGTVVKVEFWTGTYKLGEDSSAPYSIAWTIGQAGTGFLHAVAIDDDGAQTTSAVITVEKVTQTSPNTRTITLANITGMAWACSATTAVVTRGQATTTVANLARQVAHVLSLTPSSPN
jgi:hypothetical protein